VECYQGLQFNKVGGQRTMVTLTARCHCTAEQFHAAKLHDDSEGWSMYGTPTLLA